MFHYERKQQELAYAEALRQDKAKAKAKAIAKTEVNVPEVKPTMQELRDARVLFFSKLK